MGKYLKLGHQAPKGSRVNTFNSVEIDGDFAYCISHNFVYQPDVEKEKLYNALPCYYTDNRFVDTFHNFYKNTYIHWTRHKDISLKSCIRKTLNCRNIPVGTIVKFGKSWYYPKKRKVDVSYKFKIRKENKLDLNFEINDPLYFENFTTCEFSQNLTNALRENGFIVKILKENTNRISSMIQTAAAYTGKYVETEPEQGEAAIAFGKGKKIGFSSYNDTLFGYGNGMNNILWDKFGEFDKWSRCNEIPKTTSINEIMDILNTKNEPVEVD